MDYRTFARTIAAHWQLFIGTLLACLAGAAAITALQTKSYESTSPRPLPRPESFAQPRTRCRL